MAPGWIESATLTGRRSLPIFRHKPKSADRYVSMVPIRNTARERRGSVEGHADPLLFAPDDVTRNVRTVRLKDKIETIGEVAGASNFERRPRNGNVADQAVNRAAGELNRSRHQDRFARFRASFHDTPMC